MKPPCAAAVPAAHRINAHRIAAPLLAAALLAASLAAAPAASALTHTGSAHQFAGGFAPSSAPHGGFGGGACIAERTPVVFLHGNGDEARNWDYPPSTGGPSVYETFRAAGYTDCELFGVDYLSAVERGAPQLNFHKPAKAELVAGFLRDVMAYTGASQVDVVAHSLGVTVGLHALDRGGLWGSTRRFVAIGGALRGLASCLWAGYANPAVPVCGSQNAWAPEVYGLYPHTWYAWNARMGNGGYRDRPGGKATRFYSLHAGYHDQVLCTTSSYHAGCYGSALFDGYPNVAAQLDVGAGSTAAQLDYDFADWSPFNLSGGDLDGVGHFRSKNDTGAVQVEMLTTSCTGAACCGGYAGSCGP